MSEMMTVRPEFRFDEERVARFLRGKRVPLGDGPMQVYQFPDGVSNLTYLLRTDHWEGVLRRPPLGRVAPGSHDMVREHRILAALQPLWSLAPQPYILCDDRSVTGVPFYVMERRQGVVVGRDWPASLPRTEQTGRALSEAVVDTLVSLHALPWQGTALADIDRTDTFAKRQVTGWIDRYQAARTSEIDVLPRLTEWLVANRPERSEVAVRHGDYKLSNLMLDPADPSRITAVLDWEMATLGDPLLDLATLLVYWNEPGDEQYLGPLVSATWQPGFFSRREMLERYARKSGRDLSQIGYYLAYAFFRVAVIWQQRYYRWWHGQTKDERFRGLGQVVEYLLREADLATRKPVI